MDSQTASAQGGAVTIEAQRAATLAALNAGEHVADRPAADPTPDAKADQQEAAPVEPVEPVEPQEATDDGDDEDDDAAVEAKADEDDDEDDDEDAPNTGDPDTDKRLAKVHKAERRAKERVAKDRQAFERDRDQFVAEWKPRVDAAMRFERLAARAKYNLPEVLQELGLGEDDFEESARELYAHSKKGAADPANKSAAMAARQRNEMLAEIKELKKWKEEREQNEAKTASERASSEAAQRFVASVAKAAGDDQPMIKRLITTNQARAEAFITAAAADLWNELGEQPSPRRVLKRAERRYRDEVRALGLEPATKPAAAKARDAKTAAARPAPAPAPTSSAATARSIQDQRSETLRLLESGNLDL